MSFADHPTARAWCGRTTRASSRPTSSTALNALVCSAIGRPTPSSNAIPSDVLIVSGSRTIQLAPERKPRPWPRAVQEASTSLVHPEEGRQRLRGPDCCHSARSLGRQPVPPADVLKAVLEAGRDDRRRKRQGRRLDQRPAQGGASARPAYFEQALVNEALRGRGLLHWAP